MCSYPIQKFKENWKHAIDLNDTNASHCHLATVAEDNSPRSRVCFMRDISNDSITIYLNELSPKWTELKHNPNYEISVFWHSLEMQYRAKGTVEQLSNPEMTTRWTRKPYRSKLLDYYYRDVRSQSSIIPSREILEEEIQQLAKKYPTDESLPYIDSAIGAVFNIHELEEWKMSSTDRLHHRKLYSKEKTGWSESILIP